MTNLDPSLRMLPEHMRQFFWDNADRFAVLRPTTMTIAAEPIRGGPQGDFCPTTHRAIFLRNLYAPHWPELYLAILGGSRKLPEALYWTRNHDLAREAICTLLLRGDAMWEERAKAADRSREPISAGKRDVVREAALSLATPKLSVNEPAYPVAAAPKVGSVRLATGARALIEAWTGSEWIPLRALSINFRDEGPDQHRPQIIATFESERGETRLDRVTRTAEQGGDFA